MTKRAVDEERYRQAESSFWRSLGLAPTEQQLRLEQTGTSIRVQEIGSGSPVIFVHGTSNGGTSWAPLAAAMVEYRCVLVDRPGCGLSEPLRSPFGTVAELQAFADGFIADVLDSLGLERALVVATSFGGFIALRAAAAHPERIDRMVEFGYAFGAPIDKIPLMMRLASVPFLGRAMTHIRPTRSVVRSMLRQIGLRDALDAGVVSDEFVEWFLAVLRDTDTLGNELAANPPIIHPIRGMNREVELSPELLGSIEIPVKFVWGTNDIFGGADVARPFTARIPGAELELMEGAGHAPWVDDPDQAASSTKSFFG